MTSVEAVGQEEPQQPTVFGLFSVVSRDASLDHLKRNHRKMVAGQ